MNKLFIVLSISMIGCGGGEFNQNLVGPVNASAGTSGNKSVDSGTNDVGSSGGTNSGGANSGGTNSGGANSSGAAGSQSVDSGVESGGTNSGGVNTGGSAGSTFVDSGVNDSSITKSCSSVKDCVLEDCVIPTCISGLCGSTFAPIGTKCTTGFCNEHGNCSVCGDKKCTSGETCESCLQDCGIESKLCYKKVDSQGNETCGCENKLRCEPFVSQKCENYDCCTDGSISHGCRCYNIPADVVGVTCESYYNHTSC
jgi:hypothetical protein